MEKKQHLLVIAYAITIHESQGGDLEFIAGNLNYANDKEPNVASVNRVQVFTSHSLATSCCKIKLVNFEPKHLKCNHEAKKKMEKMKKESRFVWKHPLTEISDHVICLFNIRLWKSHTHHFLSNQIYTEQFTKLCFTETNLSDQIL